MSSEENHEETPETTIESIFIPEIWTRIVSYLSDKDLLNLRECSHATENAVANADRLIREDIGRTGRSKMFITLTNREFKVHFGGKLKFLIKEKKRPPPPPKPEKKGFIRSLKKKIFGVDNREAAPHWYIEKTEILEVVKMRSRLFKRVTVRKVTIDMVDLKVPFSWIAYLLKDCIFRQLSLTIGFGAITPDVIDFLHKHSKKVIKLSIPSIANDANLVLSLNRMDELLIREGELVLSDEELFELIKKRHVRMELPTVISHAQTLVDMIQTMLAWNGIQIIDLNVRTKALREFVDMDHDGRLKLYPMHARSIGSLQYMVIYSARVTIYFSEEAYAKRPREVQSISIGQTAVPHYGY